MPRKLVIQRRQPMSSNCPVRDFERVAAAPVVAIDSLRVARGERLSLRGPSGSGKSTLLSLLAGILAAQSGSVLSWGMNWAR